MDLIIFIVSVVVCTILLRVVCQKINPKISWLLPSVLGFGLAAIFTISFLMFLNSKSSVPNETKIGDKTITETSDTTKMTEKDAYTFAKQLSLKILDDSTYVETAYKNNDLESLKGYISDWETFANTPFSKVEMQKPNGLAYFPNTPLMDDYTKCDTAFIDLHLMANADYNYLRNKTEALRNIQIKQEKQFKQSKVECEKIISVANAK